MAPKRKSKKVFKVKAEVDFEGLYSALEKAENAFRDMELALSDITDAYDALGVAMDMLREERTSLEDDCVDDFGREFGSILDGVEDLENDIVEARDTLEEVINMEVPDSTLLLEDIDELLASQDEDDDDDE